MGISNNSDGSRRFIRSGVFTVFTVFLGVGAPFVAGAEELTVRDAVARALESDTRIESAILDATVAKSSVEEARWNRIPSVTLSAGYSQLSDVSSTITFGSTEIPLESQNNAVSLQANLQYPVFAGFRLREAIRLAELNAYGKEIQTEITRRAVVFETERAYWEAVRATNAVLRLRENLSLMERNRDVIRRKLEQGTVLNADLLSAEMRCDQAEMELQDAIMNRDRALIVVESLVASGDAYDGNGDLTLISDPAVLVPPLATEEEALIRIALEGRPELQAANLMVDVAASNRDRAEASLYPTVALTGNFTYANPNSRVVFQSESQFTGTWVVGAALSYDLGALPGNRTAIETRETEVHKSVVDRDRQSAIVVRDVRMCLLVYNQTKADLDMVSGMVEQATENERVVAQRVRLGTAGDIDQLTASVGRLRSEYSVINKEIDLQIAAADLRRAAALDVLE